MVRLRAFLGAVQVVRPSGGIFDAERALMSMLGIRISHNCLALVRAPLGQASHRGHHTDLVWCHAVAFGHLAEGKKVR